MATRQRGGANRNLHYHNALFLLKNKNLTVKDQLKGLRNRVHKLAIKDGV